MARPGENMVRAAALAFMRQYCTDSGHPFVHDDLAKGKFEIAGQDILPAIAAVIAQVGAMPEPRRGSTINPDGSPYMSRRYTATASEAYEALQRAMRRQRGMG